MATFSNFKSTLVAAADTAAGASSAATTVVADINALIALTGMSDGDQAFVTANNNLYFYSSGWYKIATVANDSPTSITGVSGSYALDISGGTTVITAVSSDPEGFPLTWSYSTTGLGSIATISQSSNVFTITPSTNTANAGSFTLTINVTDGTNGAVSTSSTLTLQFSITNSNYTTRLLTVVDTSDNNNITDASSNNLSITANGNATAGTFSPYRHGGYSTYFDGSSALRISDDSSLQFGSGQFTVEFWFYAKNLGGTIGLVAKRDSVSNYWRFLSSSGSLNFRHNDVIISSSTSVVTGRWYHVAVTRDASNDTRFFVDGTLISTNNSNADLSIVGSTVRIGEYEQNAGQFDGYIIDARFIKGTALYTSAFTPTTARLEAVTNTTLLTCHLPYIKDGSTNNHAITIAGDVTPKTFSPYDHSGYSASDHGGSIYFDGNNSTNLTLTDIPLPATTDFTAEFWIYPVDLSQTSNGLISQYTPSDSGRTLFYILNGQPRIFIGGTAILGSALSTNRWYHLAWVRNSGTDTLYVNGVLDVSSSSLGSIEQTGMWIGSFDNPPGTFTGYMSDIKITRSAVYTSAFTPPTSPTSSSGATLHVKGTDASIIDQAQGTNLVLPNSGVTSSTTQVKFASTKSIYFDGTSSAGVTIGTNLFLDAINTEYTLEMWYYPTQTGSHSFLMSSYLSTSTGRWLLHQQPDSQIRFFGNLNGTQQIFTAAISANNWYHVAVVRKSNGYMSIFLNGTETELALDLNGYATVLDRPVLLGSGDTFNSGGCQGYIQDVRITKGLARYTSNFTPPTSELTG